MNEKRPIKKIIVNGQRHDASMGFIYHEKQDLHDCPGAAVSTFAFWGS